MYQVLRDSLLTLNHHGDVGPYANNLRLFEATGVGTLLITDWKENLAEMFEPGKEVIVYRTPEECAELIKYTWNTTMSGKPLPERVSSGRCESTLLINACRT